MTRSHEPQPCVCILPISLTLKTPEIVILVLLLFFSVPYVVTPPPLLTAWISRFFPMPYRRPVLRPPMRYELVSLSRRAPKKTSAQREEKCHSVSPQPSFFATGCFYMKVLSAITVPPAIPIDTILCKFSVPPSSSRSPLSFRSLETLHSGSTLPPLLIVVGCSSIDSFFFHILFITVVVLDSSKVIARLQIPPSPLPLQLAGNRYFWFFPPLECFPGLLDFPLQLPLHREGLFPSQSYSPPSPALDFFRCFGRRFWIPLLVTVDDFSFPSSFSSSVSFTSLLALC